jgi:hypothetical protein
MYKTTRLRMFDNRVLRRIFGLTRDVVTGGSRKLHNEELHNLYSSPSIIRMMRWARLVARMRARICLPQDRKRWRDLVECSNSPSGSIKCWKAYGVAAQPVASRAVLSSIETVTSKRN